MKSYSSVKYCVFILAALFLLINCNSSTNSVTPVTIDSENELSTVDSKFDSIVVSYLDWNLRTRSSLSPADVRDYNTGRNAVFTIKDSKIINSIIESLSPSELTFIVSIESADTRMVLDFYVGNERVKEIGLSGPFASIFDNGNLYSSTTLYRILDKEIPKTTAPF